MPDFDVFYPLYILRFLLIPHILYIGGIGLYIPPHALACIEITAILQFIQFYSYMISGHLLVHHMMNVMN